MSDHRRALLLPLCALFVAGLSHAGMIQYEVTDLGQSDYRYTYYTSGMTFLENQELDIVFSAALYGTLSGGVASPGFDLILFQPNDPPGTSGHFSALALSDIGAGGAQFSVDFLFIGPGQPGSQPFLINQYDEKGNFLTTLESGFTSAARQDVPEPGTLVLVGLVVVGGGVWRAVRRRSARTA